MLEKDAEKVQAKEGSRIEGRGGRGYLSTPWARKGVEWRAERRLALWIQGYRPKSIGRLEWSSLGLTRVPSDLESSER